MRSVFATGLLLLAMAGPSEAQEQGAPPEPVVGGMGELRLGGLWPQAPLVSDGLEPGASTSFMGGTRFGVYFNRALAGRLSLQFVIDYTQLGSVEGVDAPLGRIKREGHWFAFTPEIAVDLVRASRVSADVHAGPSVVGELSTFLLERAAGSCTASTYLCDPYKNVCDLAAFHDRCSEHYRGAFAIGFGGRWHPMSRSRFYVGVDYTWLSYGRHVVVAVMGMRTRY